MGELLTLGMNLLTKKASYSLGASYSIILTSFCLIIDPWGCDADERNCMPLASRVRSPFCSFMYARVTEVELIT